MDKSVSMNHEHRLVCSVAPQWSAQCCWNPTTDPGRGWVRIRTSKCPGRGCHGVTGGGAAAVLQCCSGGVARPLKISGQVIPLARRGPARNPAPRGYVSAALSKLKTLASYPVPEVAGAGAVA